MALSVFNWSGIFKTLSRDRGGRINEQSKKVHDCSLLSRRLTSIGKDAEGRKEGQSKCTIEHV